MIMNLVITKNYFRFVAVLLIGVFIATNMVPDQAFAASKIKRWTGEHVVGFTNAGWANITTSSSLTLYYVDSGTTRTFTSRCSTTLFRSLNDPAITEKGAYSMGRVIHYNPNQVICDLGSVTHAFILPLPYVAWRHKDSQLNVAHKIGSSGYAQFAYAITGCVNPISKINKFYNIAIE